MSKYNIDVTSPEKAKLPQGKTCEYTYSAGTADTYTAKVSGTDDYAATVTAQWVDATHDGSSHATSADGLTTV